MYSFPNRKQEAGLSREIWVVLALRHRRNVVSAPPSISSELTLDWNGLDDFARTPLPMIVTIPDRITCMCYVGPCVRSVDCRERIKWQGAGTLSGTYTTEPRRSFVQVRSSMHLLFVLTALMGLPISCRILSGTSNRCYYLHSIRQRRIRPNTAKATTGQYCASNARKGSKIL